MWWWWGGKPGKVEFESTTVDHTAIFASHKLILSCPAALLIIKNHWRGFSDMCVRFLWFFPYFWYQSTDDPLIQSVQCRCAYWCFDLRELHRTAIFTFGDDGEYRGRPLSVWGCEKYFHSNAICVDTNYHPAVPKPTDSPLPNACLTCRTISSLAVYALQSDVQSIEVGYVRNPRKK